MNMRWLRWLKQNSFSMQLKYMGLIQNYSNDIWVKMNTSGEFEPNLQISPSDSLSTPAFSQQGHSFKTFTCRKNKYKWECKYKIFCKICDQCYGKHSYIILNQIQLYLKLNVANSLFVFLYLKRINDKGIIYIWTINGRY